MSRYTGPKSRISRRLGTNIWGTSGESRALERRPYPPGEHGRSRRRNASEYLLQLQEKQKARFTYGLTMPVPQPLRGGEPAQGRVPRADAQLLDGA